MNRATEAVLLSFPSFFFFFPLPSFVIFYRDHELIACGSTVRLSENIEKLEYYPSCLAFCCSVPAFSICEIDKKVIRDKRFMHNSIAKLFLPSGEMYTDRFNSVFFLQEYELLF